MRLFKYYALRVLRKIGVLGFLNINMKVMDSRVPILGGVGIDHFTPSEPWMKDLLAVLINAPCADRGRTMLDVGVNIGQTLIKLKQIDSEFNYIGIEPNPSCIWYVERLIKTNQWLNAKVLPAAVSGESGFITLDLYGDTHFDSGASTVDNFRSNKRGSLTVVGVSGDILVRGITERIDILKIDIEGSESVAIDALSEKIANDRPFVIMEILPVYNLENSLRLSSQEKIEKAFKSLKYYMYRVRKENDRLVGIDLINEIGVHSDMLLVDYLFSPRRIELENRTLTFLDD